MTTREYLEVYRPHPGWSGALPVAGFVAALAAAALQTAWWFSHGWTWSNLVRFLASGQPVTWCVILILVGASLSWMGLHNVRGGKEGREWAVAGLVISALAAIPIMLGVLLIAVLLLLVGAFVNNGSRRTARGIGGGVDDEGRSGPIPAVVGGDGPMRSARPAHRPPGPDSTTVPAHRS